MRSIWADFLTSLGQKRGAARRGRRRLVEAAWGSCEGLECRVLLTADFTMYEGEMVSYPFQFLDIGNQTDIDPASITTTMGSVSWDSLNQTWVWEPGPTNGDYEGVVRIAGTTFEGSVQGADFYLEILNVAPQITLGSNQVHVAEGDIATIMGTWFDPGYGDEVHLFTSLGTIETFPDGTWTWSFDTTGHTIFSEEIEIAALDFDGGETYEYFQLIVDQPPQITVCQGAEGVEVDEGEEAFACGDWLLPANFELGIEANITANIGTVTQSSLDGAFGSWGWIYSTPDGPGDSQDVVITATDVNGNSVSVSFPLIVHNTDPYVFSETSSVEVNEGALAIMHGYAGEYRLLNDGVTVTASVGEVVYDEETQDFTWTLDTSIGSIQSQTVTLTATDKDGGTSSSTFDLIVNNLPPAVSVNWNWVYALEGETAWVTGTWSDPGGDVVTLSCDRGAIFQNLDGTWLWTFDSTDGPDESGMVTITATDVEGGIKTASFHLEIGNQSPTLGADADRVSFSADEFVTMTGTWSDPGMDEVTLTTSLGTVVKNPNGTWTWTYQTDENTPDLQLVWIQGVDESGSNSWAHFDLESTTPGPSNLVVFGGTVSVGQVFSLRGSFVDPNSSDEHWVKIVWGDGLTETEILPIGSRSFSFDHTYDEESSGEPGGEYSVAVSVSDDGGMTWHESDSVTRESILPDGEQGDSDSVRGSISADGRYVAFSTYAQNFYPDEDSWYNDIFLRDRVTGELITVSRGVGGVKPNGGSFDPSISADGRYIAFSSLASNLVSDDTNESEDVFVFDRVTGTIELVSVDSDENPSDSYSYFPSISGDGRFVAFVSGSESLIPGDTNSRDDIFVRDRLAGTTVGISVDSQGNTGNGESYQPSISADGRYVSFTSDSSNLVSDDTNGEHDVFVRDLINGSTVRASVDSLGNQNQNFVFQSTISSDGRYVSFIALDQNLDPLDSNPDYDAYVHDLMTGITVCVSRDSSGLQPNDAVESVSISGDGRFVVFSTQADNLFPGDNGWSDDVFLVDRSTGSMVLISQGMFGALEESSSIEPRISSDGRSIVLSSYADNLIPGDTNLNLDVFVFANPFLPLVGVKVVATNHAPVLDNSGSPVLDPVGLNASPESIAGTLVSDLIARMGPNGGITDPDSGALFGIAVNATSGTGTGTWQYSVDNGASWTNVGAVSNDGARLLAADAETRIRYVPNAGFIGEVKISFTAWDQTVGSNGGSGVTKNRGGGSTFSIGYEYASLFVTNSAPVLDAAGSPSLDSILGGVADANNPGTLISDLITRMGPSGGISDPNPGSQYGIAINGLGGTATGVWEYTVNNGTNWTPIATTGNSNARLLAADPNTRIRYRPNVGFLGEVKIAFTAWDRTSGANGSVANIASRGGTTAFSLAYEYASLFVVNGAPVLTPSNAAYLDMIPVNVSNGANVGTLVSDLITRVGFGGASDPNPGALTGIAINGLGGTSSGTWEYSIDGGTSWSSVGTTGNANARLLAANSSTRIRYVPNTGFSGSVKLAFVLWDQTSGVNGGVTNVGTRGGVTAFSALYDYATLGVA